MIVNLERRETASVFILANSILIDRKIHISIKECVVRDMQQIIGDVNCGSEINVTGRQHDERTGICLADK